MVITDKSKLILFRYFKIRYYSRVPNSKLDTASESTASPFWGMMWESNWGEGCKVPGYSNLPTGYTYFKKRSMFVLSNGDIYLSPGRTYNLEPGNYSDIYCVFKPTTSEPRKLGTTLPQRPATEIKTKYILFITRLLVCIFNTIVLIIYLLLTKAFINILSLRYQHTPMLLFLPRWKSCCLSKHFSSQHLSWEARNKFTNIHNVVILCRASYSARKALPCYLERRIKCEKTKSGNIGCKETT